MDNKDIVIYIFGLLILILVVVLAFNYLKNKNQNKDQNKVSKENYTFSNNFVEYRNKKQKNTEKINDLIINRGDNKVVTSQQNLTPEYVEELSVAKNIDALDFGMRKDINMDEYKEFLNNHDDDLYTSIFEPEEIFERAVQFDPSIPSEDNVRNKFKQCMMDGTNTVEGCLTYSSSSLYPGLTKSLCQEYYNPLSPICQQIESRQLRQQNTSGRSGPN